MRPIHPRCPRCGRGFGIFFVGLITPAKHKVCKRCSDEYLVSLARNEDDKIEATFELVLRRFPVSADERMAAKMAGNRPAAAE